VLLDNNAIAQGYLRALPDEREPKVAYYKNLDTNGK
jgi:hypothetical protein